MTDPREMEFRETRREDPARFLRELRALRTQAGLGHAELAARAHYPHDAIKAAEAGPALPDLPVLSAYVRGCGGTVAEWEERWRAVTGSPASPLLTARGTGWSEAADAGARVGAASFAADEQDSYRVVAALNRVANGMAAASASSASPAPTGAATSAESIDVRTPAARADGNGTRAASAAAHAVQQTRMEADALTAEPAPAPGDAPGSAEAAIRHRQPPAAAPPAAEPPVTAGRTARPRPPFASRTAVAGYAAVALLLVVALIALFA